MEGIKKYRVCHEFEDYEVTYTIDFGLKESEHGSDTISNIKEMAEFWSGCPDRDTQELTESKLDFFLKVATAKIITELVMNDYISSTDVAISVMRNQEGYYPLDGSHGVMVTSVWGMTIPPSDEYEVWVV